MSVKEKVIGIVMNRPPKPDPQDVPIGIQKLVASGVPYTINPNPNLICEGIPAPTVGEQFEQQLANLLADASAPDSLQGCRENDRIAEGLDAMGKADEDMGVYDKVILPQELTPEESKAFEAAWDDAYGIQRVAEPTKVTYIAPDMAVQKLVESGAWEYDLPPASEFSTNTAPSESRSSQTLTPQQVSALYAVSLGCSIQVADKLARLDADIAFIKTKLGLDS